MKKKSNSSCFVRLIQQCACNQITTHEAAVASGLSQRTIQRDVLKYRAGGCSALVHGNTGTRRESAESAALSLRIIDIFRNTSVNGKNPFDGISYAYFQEILEEDYGIKKSVSFVKKVLLSDGYHTPVKHRYRKEAAHLMRKRKEHMGELVQADGTSFDWFGDGRTYCIQGFVDDATTRPVGLYMTKNECLLGYVEATRNMVTQFGIPQAIYPDKSSVFFVNKKNTDDGECHLTQFGLIMEELGVDMFPAHSPQAKGRIERFWETIQKRLPILFAMRGICTVEAANDFLRDEFPTIFHKWFPVKPSSSESLFVEANAEQINNVLKATYPGKVDRGGVFSLMGYKFFCGKLCGKKILIHLNEKRGLWVTPLDSNTEYSVVLMETDSSGRMSEVTKDLIHRTFLKNAKPKYREVYVDVDDIVLSEIRPSKKRMRA